MSATALCGWKLRVHSTETWASSHVAEHVTEGSSTGHCEDRVLGAKLFKFHKNYGFRLVLEKIDVGSFKGGLLLLCAALEGIHKKQCRVKCSDLQQAEVSEWVFPITLVDRELNSRGFSTECIWKKSQIEHLLTNYTESIIALRLTSCWKGISFKLGVSSCLSFHVWTIVGWLENESG